MSLSQLKALEILMKKNPHRVFNTAGLSDHEKKQLQLEIETDGNIKYLSKTPFASIIRDFGILLKSGTIKKLDMGKYQYVSLDEEKEDNEEVKQEKEKEIKGDEDIPSIPKTYIEGVKNFVVNQIGQMKEILERFFPTENSQLIDIVGGQSDVEGKGKNGKGKNNNKKSGKGGFLAQISQDKMDLIEKVKDRMSVIDGPMQSFKSQVITSLILMFYAFNVNSVLITRNNTFEKVGFKCKFADFAKSMGIDLTKYNLDQKIVSMIDKNYDNNRVRKSFEMQSVDPLVLISISHRSSLEEVAKSARNNNSVFALFIDEADFVDSNSDTSDILQELKQLATCVFFISATPIDPIIKNKCKYVDYIRLNPPEHYKGIDTFKFKSIAPECKFTAKAAGDILVSDVGMKDYLKDVTKRSPIHVDVYNEKHPVMHLIAVSNVIAPQNKLRDYIMKNYSKDVAVVTMYDKYITFYHHTLTKVDAIETDQVISTRLDKLHYIGKRFCMSNVINYMRLNGGVKVFPRILILAGTLAGRANSFTSGSCIGSDMGWRLTGYRMLVANNTDLPELEQKAGRGCCNAKGGIRLEIYTTPKIWSDIVKAYWSRCELLERSHEYANLGITMDVGIQKVPILKEKISRRSLTKTEDYKLNLQKIVDNGWNISKYINLIKEEKEEDVDEKFEDDEKDEVETIGDYYLIDCNKLFKSKGKQFVSYFEVYKQIETIFMDEDEGLGGGGDWVNRSEIITRLIKLRNENLNASNIQKYATIFNHFISTYSTPTDDLTASGLILADTKSDSQKKLRVKYNE